MKNLAVLTKRKWLKYSSRARKGFVAIPIMKWFVLVTWKDNVL